MSNSFSDRLLPKLPQLVSEYRTPFHIYDERSIVATHRRLAQAFSDIQFGQFFAVKALPTPAVMAKLIEAGSGLDCSSEIELEFAARLGLRGPSIVFTSNNTSSREYEVARAADALITFDDLGFFEKVTELPAVVAFRVAPHGLGSGSRQMGDPGQSKFGVPPDRLSYAYRTAIARGARRFGLHGMMYANELTLKHALNAAVAVIELAARLATELGIEMEYINIGGGLGIPYHPWDREFDLQGYSAGLKESLCRLFPQRRPTLLMELGRYITGPHGVLVTSVINCMRKSRDLVGLDASMSALMRPALYGAYHHITLPFAGQRTQGVYDVVGALCENFDKFAIQRPLPEPRIGDIVLIHDTGAHGHAMGFSYNGRLRPAELLLTDAGDVMEIRRAETFSDHIAAVCWNPRPVLLDSVGA